MGNKQQAPSRAPLAVLVSLVLMSLTHCKSSTDGPPSDGGQLSDSDAVNDAATLTTCVHSSRQSSLPREPLPIVIDPPVLQSSRVLSVTSYGASTSSPDNTAAFQAAINAAVGVPGTRLTVPTGTYRFADPALRRVMFEGLTDFAFDGGGSTFIFEEFGYFGFRNIERATFENFTVDWDWERGGPLAYVFEVVERDVAAGTMVLELVYPSELDPAVAPLIVWRNVEMVQPVTYAPTPAGYEIWTGGVAFDSMVGTNRIRLRVGGDMLSFPVGSTLRNRQWDYDCHALITEAIEHVSFRNVDVHGAPGMAWVGFTDSHHFEIIDSDVVPPPGSGRPLSAAADGFHVGGTQGFFRLEGSEFALQGDDALNLKDPSSLGVRVIDSRTIETINTQWWRHYFHPGDVLAFRNADYTMAMTSPPIVTSDFLENQDSYRLTFASDLPAGLGANTLVFNTRFDTHNFIIRGNRFANNRARGILVKGSGLIENNVFTGMSGAPIVIEVGHPEGTIVDGLIIRGNTFDSCDAYRWYSGQIESIVLDIPGGAHPVWRPLRNIFISNNTFSNFPGEAIHLQDVDGATIAGNQFELGDTPARTDLIWGRIGLEHSSNLSACCNDWGATFPEENRGLTVDTASVSGVGDCAQP